MTAQTNATLIRSLFTAFNTRKLNELVKHMSPKVEWRNMATGEVFKGPDGVRKFLESWISAFEDIRLDVRHMAATDQHVATEFGARATHTATLETPNGPLPATNRKVDLALCELATIENGKITSIRTYYDSATMMAQLGVTELAGANK